MHMKYLLLVIHEFLSVYLICSASKLTSQIEVKFKCRSKRDKICHYFLSVVLFVCSHSQILLLLWFYGWGFLMFLLKQVPNCFVS